MDGAGMRRERARECRGRTEATQNGSRVCEKLHSCTAMAGGGPPSGGSMEADFRGVWPRRRTCARAGQAEGRALGGGARPQRYLVCVRTISPATYSTQKEKNVAAFVQRRSWEPRIPTIKGRSETRCSYRTAQAKSGAYFAKICRLW